MAKIGKNILENLTTGMYSDSRITYREYIQNACDQIDKAIKRGILTEEDALIDIYIDPKKRYISIKDNATGASANSFQQELGDIANSDKVIGEEKGFRGIGRLCGLAYCKTLMFSTSFQGEDTISIMIWDAEKLRNLLMDKKKHTIDDVINQVVKFEKKENEDVDSHYFEVELIDINKENTDLLNGKKVKQYLNFVAPVPYKNTFILRNQIYDFACSLNYKIDEYVIKVNGEQIFKEYKTSLYENGESNLKKYDDISKLEFKVFNNTKDEILAWMWIGLSRFEKAIPKSTNPMRGLRLRKDNIQIGSEDNDKIQDLFKEKRGNSYFVGEIIAVDQGLIPNSQRNYFNENEARVLLENSLREYFYETLHKLYHDANRLKNAYKKQVGYLEKVQEFNEKSRMNSFIDEEQKQKLQIQINSAEKDVATAKKHLEKMDEIDEESPISEVFLSIKKKFNGEKLEKRLSKTKPPNGEEKSKKKSPYIASSLSKLTKSERKIVGKIYSIITEMAPKDLSEKIIEKIQEELK